MHPARVFSVIVVGPKKTMLQRRMTTTVRLSHLSDDDLVSHVATVVGEERRATARLVAALVEFAARQLYLAQGCASLFTYCTNVLHLSEAATYNRTEAVRAAARFPTVLARLEDGSLTLTAVRVLAPVLTPDNCESLLAKAVHKSRREIELLVATARPRPDVPVVIRKLPARAAANAASAQPDVAVARCGQPATALSPALEDDSWAKSALTTTPSTPCAAPPRAPAIAPLSAERFKIQFTASRQFHDKLRHAQDLTRHAIPNGNPAVILERALDLLIAQVEKRKLGSAERPRTPRSADPSSRHIPAAVRRQVSLRDENQCAFIGRAGRCRERAFLEFHHVHPFADGGRSTADNIQLRCRAHNRYEAELVFGLAPVMDDDADPVDETYQEHP